MIPRSGRFNPNTKVAVICAAVAVGMIGLAYASVPLYSLFCRVTGYAGTTQRVEAPSHEVLDRVVTVRFDSNIAPGLDWDFAPVVTQMKLHIGENALAFYRATNHSKEPVVGTATFNVTPDQAGSFFNKIQCFCFTEQRLEPGESVDMPVSFYVDPAIVKDPDGVHIHTITLSYTFHPVAKPKASAALAPSAPAATGPSTKTSPPG